MLNLIWGFLIHPLSYLTPLTTQLNQWVYLILFIWIFLETAFIFFSFLPGQSVLFLTGTIASTAPAHLNIFLLLLTFIAAATTGAMVKYWYGVNLESKNKIAQKISDSPQLDQTQKLFDKNTKKSLVFSRFIPFVGLFVPIIAGTTQMDWRRFNKLNFAGVLLWVLTCCFAGYFFGRTAFARQYFTLIFLMLIFVPFMIELIWRKIKGRVQTDAT